MEWLYLIVPWAAFGLCWRKGWFEAARIAAALGTLVLSLIAAYHWQAYDRAWAMWVPCIIGMVVVTACGKAKGEGAKALGTAALAVVLPVLLMLLTFNYFQKMFLLIRANESVREVVPITGEVAKLPPDRRAETVQGLIAALEHEDEFVRWGALYNLWLAGPDAAGAAEPVARAMAASRADPRRVQTEHFRRDGMHFLESLGAKAGPALLIVLREGDETRRDDALRALGRLGPAFKDAALPELVRLSTAGSPGLPYALEEARKGLGVTEVEWKAALSPPAP